MQELAFQFPQYSGDSYSVLTRLPSLRRLMLIAPGDLPACLPQLSRREALSLETVRRDAEIITQALPRLQRLTGLMLSMDPGQELPAQLASLTSLHSLAWLVRRSEPLPTGPWLSGLRRLAAPGSVLAASLPALAAARRLQLLVITPSEKCSHAASTLAVVAGLPALLRLVVDDDDAFLKGSSAEQAFEDMKRCNPSVNIEWIVDAPAVLELYSEIWCSNYLDTSREVFLGSARPRW